MSATSCMDCRHPIRNHRGAGCTRCECSWVGDDIAKTLTPTAHRVAMIEVAERVFNRHTGTPGLNYARRANEPGKADARRRLLRLWNRSSFPNGFAITTLPSTAWTFESALLQSREGRSGGHKQSPRFNVQSRTRRTYITAIEREPALYLAALKDIPGGKQGIAHVDPAAYASRSVKTSQIARFHLADVERYLLLEERENHAMWLDFNGPLTDARAAGVSRVWRMGLVREHLAVTVLCARQQSEFDASNVAGTLRSLCPGSVLVDAFHYQSGRVPMSQIVIGREAK